MPVILANPKYQGTLQLVIISELSEQKITAESMWDAPPSFIQYWPSLEENIPVSCSLGSLLSACWAARDSAAPTNPWALPARGELCRFPCWFPGSLVTHSSVPLDSSTTVRYKMGWTGTNKRGGKRVARNSQKKFSRGLYCQLWGKGLEGLWQFVEQNFSRETANCLCFRNTLPNSDD